MADRAARPYHSADDGFYQRLQEGNKYSDDDFSDYDIKNWLEIDKIRHQIAKDTITEKCLLTRAKDALDHSRYDEASDLQLEIQKKVNELAALYITYKKNLL